MQIAVRNDPVNLRARHPALWARRDALFENRYEVCKAPTTMRATAPTPRAQTVSPGDFEAESHFYPRVLNAQLHPMVRHFLGLSRARVTKRYCHLHPEAAPEAVESALAYAPRYFRWGGADLFHVTNDRGIRRTVVIETNSCPSGQKSVPRIDEDNELAGYRTILERVFVPMLARRGLPPGVLAVIYDKNIMEASGYAAALAQITGETVRLVPCFDNGGVNPTRVTDGVLQLREPEGTWVSVRAAFRYVTQRPWNRLPPLTKTLILNPVVVCLSGGRNKLLAAKAYDLYNAELRMTGLTIRTPETMWDVTHREVPLWIRRMGGVAVVKNPYSNAGQGVYTITNDAELERFMETEQRYDRFIVQALIGNAGWSSKGSSGSLYHIGTVPDRRGNIYAADMRFMVGASDDGFFPVAIYARRAKLALPENLDPEVPSWDVLGTNLSFRDSNGSWATEEKRLLLMDSRDFNKLGVGLDDLIEGYIQTVLAVTAIDKMAATLVTRKGKFRRRMFQSLNPDPALVQEICE